MVQNALEGWEVGKLDFLFVENVGNLVCPSSYDLGEDLRLVLLSVTEGEDKPLKYPTIFNSADVAVITKMARQYTGSAAGHAGVYGVVQERCGDGYALRLSRPQFRRAAYGDHGMIQHVIKVRKWPAFFRLSPLGSFWACAMPQTPTM